MGPVNHQETYSKLSKDVRPNNEHLARTSWQIHVSKTLTTFQALILKKKESIMSANISIIG